MIVNYSQVIFVGIEEFSISGENCYLHDPSAFLRSLRNV